MHAAARYLRLLLALGRYSLAREMAFRGNYLVKVFVEVLWLSILLIFYHTVFAQTSVVAGWSESEYLFFVGCYFSLEGLIETLFLENCNAFGDLVRTGELDFFLLKPIDEQFLISCRKFDWSTAPNVLMGAGVMGLALHQMHWSFDPIRVALFVLMFACGALMAYCFLLLMTSASIWLMRNQSLFEMWWLFTSLMRYPREIFGASWAVPVGWFFSFVVPIMLVVSVPAGVMVKVFDLKIVIFTLVAAGFLFLVSRAFFRYALKKYRSASS